MKLFDIFLPGLICGMVLVNCIMAFKNKDIHEGLGWIVAFIGWLLVFLNEIK